MIMIEDLPKVIKAMVGNQEILPMVFDQFFKHLGLTCPKYCTETFSNIDNIEEMKKCAIVTTYTMAKGVEHENIVNLSGPLCHSRSCGNIVNAPLLLSLKIVGTDSPFHFFNTNVGGAEAPHPPPACLRL